LIVFVIVLVRFVVILVVVLSVATLGLANLLGVVPLAIKRRACIVSTTRSDSLINLRRLMVF
jgi:hypothetical protein